MWARNGRELFYVAGDKMMSVAVKTTGTQFSFEPPIELFTLPTVFGATQPPSYDVTADGLFIMVQWTDAQAFSMKLIVNGVSPQASVER